MPFSEVINLFIWFLYLVRPVSFLIWNEVPVTMWIGSSVLASELFGKSELSFFSVVLTFFSLGVLISLACYIFLSVVSVV